MSRDGEKMPAPPPRFLLAPRKARRAVPASAGIGIRWMPTYSGISGAGGSQPHNDSIRKDGKECKCT